MIKRLLLPVFFSFLFLNSFAKNGTTLERPKLVVGIVIDQMRWDYLYRYYDHYGEGGFRKLLGSGFNCQNTFINYLPSFTGPGHSCIFTGSVPSIHGIASNDWIEHATGKAVYCTDDKTVLPVGGSMKWGQMSPRNLLVTTVGDELRLATNFRSRVFGISLKDRASILPAGHLANAAFWYDDSTGHFMTSTYYCKKLPRWLVDFNDRHVPDSFMRQNWTLMCDASTYINSLPDSNRYEGLNTGETAPVFPHVTTQFAGKNYDVLRRMPAGNTTTLMLAKACIDGENLGQTGNTDFLTINLASTDYTGHQYAPNAREMEDVYLRLDKDMAAFLRYLDETVGKGNYLIFITADHGAAHNSEFMKDLKIPAGNISQHGMEAELRAVLKTATGSDSLLRSLENYQVYLNEPVVSRASKSRQEIKDIIAGYFRQRADVSYVADMELMNDNDVPEPLHTMIVNGYNRARSGCLQIIPAPGYYSGAGITGTTHGTWNPYDTHIPLLWYGWHIRKGETYRTTHMTDIAATVAALLHIQIPNGCVGKVMEEVMKK